MSPFDAPYLISQIHIICFLFIIVYTFADRLWIYFLVTDVDMWRLLDKLLAFRPFRIFFDLTCWFRQWVTAFTITIWWKCTDCLWSGLYFRMILDHYFILTLVKLFSCRATMMYLIVFWFYGRNYLFMLCAFIYQRF